jgi:hypothetical protein
MPVQLLAKDVTEMDADSSSPISLMALFQYVPVRSSCMLYEWQLHTADVML